MLEWYRTDSGYLRLMDECETLIRSVTAALGKGEKIVYQGIEIDLRGKWERITVAEAFSRYTRCSMAAALQNGIFDVLMVEEIEPRLGMSGPVFIHDYPASRGALARLKADDPTVAERFELYMGGMELANAFSELTDPSEQRSRFIQEQEQRRTLGKAIYSIPEKFLAELSGMPQSSGIALGLDRLVMLLLDLLSIDEVVAFTPEEL